MLVGIKLAAQLESCHGQSNLVRSDFSFEYTRPYIRDVLEGLFNISVIRTSVTADEVFGLFEDRPEFRAVLAFSIGHGSAITPKRLQSRAAGLSCPCRALRWACRHLR